MVVVEFERSSSRIIVREDLCYRLALCVLLLLLSGNIPRSPCQISLYSVIRRRKPFGYTLSFVFGVLSSWLGEDEKFPKISRVVDDIAFLIEDSS